MGEWVEESLYKNKNLARTRVSGNICNEVVKRYFSSRNDIDCEYRKKDIRSLPCVVCHGIGIRVLK